MKLSFNQTAIDMLKMSVANIQNHINQEKIRKKIYCVSASKTTEIINSFGSKNAKYMKSSHKKKGNRIKITMRQNVKGVKAIEKTINM